MLRSRRARDRRPAWFRGRITRGGLRRRAGPAVRRLYDARGFRALSARARAVGLPPLLWPRAEGHSHALAQSPGGRLRRGAWARARRNGAGADRSLLPTLRQVAVDRPLGGDL